MWSQCDSIQSTLCFCHQQIGHCCHEIKYCNDSMVPLSTQWIGLREKLQEHPIFHGKIHGFLQIFPSTNPLIYGFQGIKACFGRLICSWGVVPNGFETLWTPRHKLVIQSSESSHSWGFLGCEACFQAKFLKLVNANLFGGLEHFLIFPNWE